MLELAQDGVVVFEQFELGGGRKIFGIGASEAVLPANERGGRSISERFSRKRFPSH